MAIQQQCPVCHFQQKLANKKCKCGANLTSLRKQQKVTYLIQYRLPNGKQKKETIGKSLDDAKAADGKRKAQKKENRVLEILQTDDVPFKELSDWYLNLSSVKKLASWETLFYNLKAFDAVLGDFPVKDITLELLEDYQTKRVKGGASECTADHEIKVAKRVVRKAWDNDKVSGKVVKTFKKVALLLKEGDNARDRILTIEELDRIVESLPLHARNVLLTAFWTGMRRKEILTLTWDRVDIKKARIKLGRQDTKTKKGRDIPMAGPLLEMFKSTPRHLNHDFVFTYRGKPFSPKGGIRKALVTACRDNKIPYGRNTKNGLTFHDLRHTFNTFMRRTGAHDSITMGITGHGTKKMFDRYNTVQEWEKAMAVTGLEQAVEKARKGNGKIEKSG